MPTTTPRTTAVKILFRIFFVILSLLLILLSLLPSILSTSWGNKQLTQRLNSALPGTITASKITISWFGPQQIDNLSLKDKDGKEILSLKLAKADSSLWSLYTHPQNSGDLLIEDLDALIVSDASGSTNIEKALNPNCCTGEDQSQNTLATISLQDVRAAIVKPRDKAPLSFSASGKTVQGDVRGTFSIDLLLDSIFAAELAHKQLDLKQLINYQRSPLTINVDISHFPVQLIDQIVGFRAPELSGIFLEAFGQELNITLKQQIQTEAKLNALVFILNSQSLNSRADFVITDTITLKSPAVATFAVTPALIEKLAKKLKINPVPTLNPPTPIKFTITDFRYPLLEDGKVEFRAKVTDISLALIDALTKMNGKLVQAAGNTADIDITYEGNDSGPKLSLEWQPEKITHAVSVEILKTGDQEFKLTANAKIPQLSADNTHQKDFEINTVTYIDSSLSSISEVRLKGSFAANNLIFAEPAGKSQTTSVIDNLSVNWSLDSPRNLIHLEINTDARLEGQASAKIKGTLAIENWLVEEEVRFNEATVQGTLFANNLPIEILNSITGRKDLLPLIGNRISTTLTGIYTPKSETGDFSIQIKSPHLNANATFIYGNNLLRLSDDITPSQISLTVTPLSYPIIRKLLGTDADNSFSLIDTSLITFSINNFQVPIPSKSMTASIYDAAFDIALSIDQLNGINAAIGQKIFLNKISSRLVTKDVTERISFNFHAKGVTGQGVSTECSLNGVLENGLTNAGALNTENMSLALDGNVDNFPITLFCQFACLDLKTQNQLEALVGPTLDGVIKTNLKQMNGSLALDLNGKNGHFRIDGLVENGTLILKKDLTAEINVTPQLSNYLLEEIIPIVDGMISADQPIKLTISKDGFSLPFNNATLLSVSVNKANLELGRVHFAPDSEIAKVLNLLISGSSEPVVVSITPLYFSIINGGVNIQRVDLLINDRYPIAAWGDVDIRRDNVDMVIGLLGASISRAFGVPGIPNRYILQLPLRGSLNHASIDKKKATARLSALVAKAQGGPEGLVLGTVLQIATGGMNEPPAPPPSTDPLPWNELLVDPEGENSFVKDIGGKPVEETFKQIKKGASNLFKQVFK